MLQIERNPLWKAWMQGHEADHGRRVLDIRDRAAEPSGLKPEAPDRPLAAPFREVAQSRRTVQRDPTRDIRRSHVLSRRWHSRACRWLSAAFAPQYQSDGAMLPWMRDRGLIQLSLTPPAPRILSSLASGSGLPPPDSLQGQLPDRPPTQSMRKICAATPDRQGG